MNIQEIIGKKRDGKELNKEEIEYFVKGYTSGEVADYQAAALIMAIYINGLNPEETTNLTMSMANSGEILDLTSISNNIVDKHSTGGVGDKVSLILLPIIASLGIPVAKMSGRGLGFTGGTIDKLESIPGYNTSIDIDGFINNVKKIGISLIGQTLNLAPADKKIYALRDVTACVGSMPLIASSIMSKKIASGANKIVLDVTVGSGAFMKTKEEAILLAKTMNRIGKLANRETICVLTNMDEPLGEMVGNTLEIIEVVESLKGNIEEDVKEVIETLGAYMIKLAGVSDNIEKNKEMILQNIQNGKAYDKFLELVKNQGGDISYLEDINKFEKAKYIIPILANEEGIVTKLNAEEVGELSVFLGAGRIKKEDIIDYASGIQLNRKIGDMIEKENILAYIHLNDESKIEEAKNRLKKAYTIEKDAKIGQKEGIIEIVE